MAEKETVGEGTEGQVWPPEPNLAPPLPDAIEQRRRLRRRGLASAVAATAIGLTAYALDAMLLWRFFHSSSILALPPGTGIRPMGFEMMMGLVMTGAFLIGGPLAIWGLALGVRGRYLPAVAWGLLGLCLCLTVYPVIGKLYLHLIAAHGLYDEP